MIFLTCSVTMTFNGTLVIIKDKNYYPFKSVIMFLIVVFLPLCDTGRKEISQFSEKMLEGLT